MRPVPQASFSCVKDTQDDFGIVPISPNQLHVNIDSHQRQYNFKQDPKLRQRNGRGFFSPILSSGAREKNGPTYKSIYDDSIQHISWPHTDPYPVHFLSLRGTVQWPRAHHLAKRMFSGEYLLERCSYNMNRSGFLLWFSWLSAILFCETAHFSKG